MAEVELPEGLGVDRLVRLRGKIPVDRSWPEVELEWPEVDAWQQQLGIKCGHVGESDYLLVVDVDVKDGAPGMKSLGALGLPKTYMTETPSGGLHLYYWMVAGPTKVNYERWPGIDIKGQNGQVAAYPAISDEGTPIAFLDNLPATFADQHTAESRNTAVYRFGCGIVNQVADFKGLVQQMRDYAHTLPTKNHAYTDRELLTSAKSAWKYREKQESEKDRQERAKGLSEVVPMTAPELLSWASELPTREPVCGPLITASWGIVAAHPGVGKSMFTLGLALAISRGEAFSYWETSRPRKVMLIDAEMSLYDYKARLATFSGSWSDNLKILTPEHFEAAEQMGFSLGDTAYQQWCTDMDWEVCIIDNIECTLFPPPGKNLSVWAPETWQQVQKFVNQNKARNRLMVIVDHLNYNDQVQGGRSKTRGADFVIKLARDVSATAEELAFTASMLQPDGGKCRYQIAKAQAKSVWRLAEGQFIGESFKGPWEIAHEMKVGGSTNAEIADYIDKSEAAVKKHFQRMGR